MTNRNLDRMFHPRSVAVVGDKRENDYMWLRSMATFQGKVFSVQIDPEELPGIETLGVENYPSLLDIPEPVDYVVVAVPRAVTPKIVEDCIRKQVGGVMLFTSGFAETNTEEGKRFQEIIAEMAIKDGLNLIGPNCMGIFNPRIGLRHSVDQYCGEGGDVGFISQSGTHATFFSLVGALNGVKVSKSVSYGNAIVLDSTDYLEYFVRDKETRIIGMYIEGVKDGRRFFRCLKEAAKEKPVLIWKGGESEEGTRATASHTGSLAESPVIWQAVTKQCGAIKVDSLEEMLDTIKVLLYIKPTTGTRVGLIATSGGQSVVVTDTFARAGLNIPLLSEESYHKLASFFNIVGGSYRNPLDISPHFRSTELILRILEILDQDENTDSLVLELSPFLLALARTWQHDPQFFNSFLDALAEFKGRCTKPFLVILIPGHMEAATIETRDELARRGIPSFPSFDRGASALRRVVEYYRFRAELGLIDLPVSAGVIR